MESFGPSIKLKKTKRYKKAKKTSEKLQNRLLLASELGDVRKVQKILDRKTVQIDARDISGQSCLHKAADQGHLTLIELLLRCGASPHLQDLNGNTPAHIAALCFQSECFTTLMLARGAPSMEVQNLQGWTIRLAMQRMLQGKLGRQNQQAQDPEEEWADKLDENEEYHQVDRDYFSGFAEMEQEQAFQENAYRVDEEEYARRMWQEMNNRQQGSQRPSAATAEIWEQADELSSHAQRVRQAAEDARERSRKILEEEQAKDRAWRQAVAQGDLGARRALYEAKWHAFAVSSGMIRLQDIPWLVHDKVDDVRAVVLHGTNGSKEARQRLKLELMRWHPDKFQAKFGQRLADRKEEILDRVKQISQVLNELMRA